ncbi:hypothetical protein TSUD_299510 [Trifolium subterraneum]|uniref:Uncharacterized protein n=1 Tax=Trifolium subterraneum TaxID=3900 RepID=A0A2Z6P6L1_TRISU|nr:hypothetical protein TSUD_299510 [Trifolium subterraneum]
MFELIVGRAGTSTKTIQLPRNFTLKALGAGYTCKPAKCVEPSKLESLARTMFPAQHVPAAVKLNLEAVPS